MAPGLNAVLMGAQIESMIYKTLRDKQITEIKDNLFFQYNDIRNSRVQIISQLIQLLVDRETANESVSLTDITNILDRYLVLRPTYSKAFVGQTYKLSELFNIYRNNQSHLSTNYNVTSFDALSDADKIMVALDALVLMASIEDAELQSYMYSTLTNGVKTADRVFSALEGSSIYEIYNTDDLMNKMFLYNNTDTDAVTYYGIIFKALFNSGHATRKMAALAEIGRYSQMLKDAEDAANKPEYLEIQVADKDLAVGPTQYNHTQFYAAAGSKVRLVPRNDTAWPDFSAFQNTQIQVALIPYNGVNEMHLTLVNASYVNGAIEFTISAGSTNGEPVTLVSGYFEVLGVEGGSNLHYSSPRQQITQMPNITTPPDGTDMSLILNDQFEVVGLDSAIWSVSGHDVTVHDGILDLQANVTDNVGRATANFFSPLKRIRVEMKHFMHPGGNFYMPGISFIAEDNSEPLNVNWVKSDYSPDYCSNSNNYNKIRISNVTGNLSCNAEFSSLSSSSQYDTWVTTVMEYNSETGLIAIDFDNDGIIDFTATQAANLRHAIKRIGLHPYGWWTGHSHKFEHIKVYGEYAPVPIATFLSENLPDNSYQIGTTTKTWRFKSGTNAITGLKAVQVSGKTSSRLGIAQTEIAIGDVAANTEFTVNLPINPVHDTTDLKSSYWTLVDANNAVVTITNSKNNDFWLKLRTNRAPEFSQLQLESVGGKTGQSVCLPLMAADPDGDALNYSVTSGGGSVVDGTCMGISGKMYQGSFASPGVVSVSIQVSDAIGATATKVIYGVITSDGAVKDFFNDLKYANATTDQLKDQYRAINYLALKGIVIGLPDPNDANGRVFEPNRVANQAEALAMLMKAASLRGFVTLDATVFPLANLSKFDPASGTYYNFSWVTPYLFKAQELGLISSATEFEPDKEATREWFASLLSALLKLEAPTDEFTNPSAYSFADSASFSAQYDYDKARAAAFFGFMGQLGSSSSFNPQSAMIRADVAVVASKVLRRPTFSSITVAGLTDRTITGETVPSVLLDQSFSVTGVAGLSGNRMLDDGTGNIKEDDLFNAGEYVTVKAIRPGMTPYLAGSKLAGVLSGSPITVQTSPPDINYSEKRSLLVLLEAADSDGRNIVRNLATVPYGVYFPDRDGDGVRDEQDLWPDNPLYHTDANGNGIPDNADAQWGLSNRQWNEIVAINGQQMTLLDAILNGLYNYPFVSRFYIPETSNSLTLDVTTFTADGGAAPYSYCLATTNSSAGCSWNSTKPTSYSFASAGAKTLYAFAKDASGKVSAARSATTTITLMQTLNVTVTNSNGGGGSVTIPTSGGNTTCDSGSCSNSFAKDSSVSLSATPNTASSFGGWSGACSGTSSGCTVVMSADKSLGALFNLVPRARIGATAYGT
ncbi:MAG: hypothetical protein OEL57_11525, partial [Trichlorobacter sp.]|uniref:InlB B-repeat-containing protein n=1 Tax=Trichlorobacter sp. TaxID=2911007 RepID=UPI00256BBCC8|nr:hypothetical protein [Trichlorobacter sp.]